MKSLSEILALKGDDLGANLLAYGGARVTTTLNRYGEDSTEYQTALENWSSIIRSHLANEA